MPKMLKQNCSQRRTNCSDSVLQTDRSSSALSSYSPSLPVNPSCISANCAALSAAPAAIIMVLWEKNNTKTRWQAPFMAVIIAFYLKSRWARQSTSSISAAKQSLIILKVRSLASYHATFIPECKDLRLVVRTSTLIHDDALRYLSLCFKPRCNK